MAAPRLLEVGRVAGAFGVRGEVRLTTFTEDPLALLRYRVLLREDGGPALTLTSGRAAKGSLVGRAKEVETREQAEALRGMRLYVPRDILPEPEEDEFYLADLIGLEARAPDGATVGRIRAVENFGAGDLLEIAPPDGPSWWLPFTREAAPEVRIADGFITVVRPGETTDGAEGQA
jgi:16S rRNA processing protein RimM